MDRYQDAYFINPAIEYGIKSYLKVKNNEPYERFHTFELYVIKTLVIIYGEKSILFPYKIDNERAFECNLLMYNLKESDLYKFISLMNDYYEFMKEYNSNNKATGIISEIEKILMEMIIRRNKRKPFTESEIRLFDEVFNPSHGDLKNLKTILSNDQGLIVRFWEERKEELSKTQLRMMAVNPNLLHPTIYQKYGLELSEIVKLTEKEIEDVNNKILAEENRIIDYTKMGKKTWRKNILLTSGNGFVDKLILLSIAATEILIGVVVFLTIGGYLW